MEPIAGTGLGQRATGAVRSWRTTSIAATVRCSPRRLASFSTVPPRGLPGRVDPVAGRIPRDAPSRPVPERQRSRSGERADFSARWRVDRISHADHRRGDCTSPRPPDSASVQCDPHWSGQPSGPVAALYFASRPAWRGVPAISPTPIPFAWTTQRSEKTGATGGSATTGSRLVVLHNRERSESWIFGAEEVLGVHRLPRSQMRSVSSTLANPEVSFSQAILSWEDRSVSFLDEQRVFAALRSIGQ